MTERNDHAAEAVNFPGATVIDTYGDDDRKVAIAQVHATLALVEQQRIANIISLGEHWQSTGYNFADSVAPILRDDIQAALGLD